MLSNILLSRLTSYIDRVIGYHHCGFWHNKSTTDQIFCILQILKKRWECTGMVPQLQIWESPWLMREVLYIILIEFDIPVKQYRQIKMCLYETRKD